MKKILTKSITQTIPAIIIGGIFGIFSIYTKIEIFTLINKYSFIIVPSILSAFIAKEICGSAGFIPALILGSITQQINLGIFGSILSGCIIGIITNYIKKIKVSIEYSSILYFVFIPICSILIGSFIVFYIFSYPIIFFNVIINNYLNTLNNENSIFLIFILGGMIGTDLGGPINKIAFLYGISTLNSNRYDIMGPIAVAICISPIAFGIAQFIFKNKFTSFDRTNGILSIILGILGISEGALIYFTNDIKNLPISIISSGIAACTAYILKVSSSAPHGGLITLLLVTNKLGFILAITSGVMISLSLIYLLSRTK